MGIRYLWLVYILNFYSLRSINLIVPQADVPHRKIIFFFHLMGTGCQLLMFTYSCDCIIQESRNLAPAVYSGPWLLLPMNENVQKLRKDLVMVIMRSHTPCCLTACKFFMVSLETYTKVIQRIIKNIVSWLKWSEILASTYLSLCCIRLHTIESPSLSVAGFDNCSIIFYTAATKRGR